MFYACVKSALNPTANCALRLNRPLAITFLLMMANLIKNKNFMPFAFEKYKGLFTCRAFDACRCGRMCFDTQIEKVLILLRTAPVCQTRTCQTHVLRMRLKAVLKREGKLILFKL